MSPQTLKDYQRVVESIYIQEQIKSNRRYTFEIKNCFYLETIPSEITLLQDTQTLKIINCPRLKTLPEELGYLENLEELIFEGSKRIPKGFKHLHKLQSLSFVNSPFLKNTNFKPLKEVAAIRKIIFDNCLQNIGQVPPTIFDISSITTLAIPKNQLTCLSTAITKLQQLQVIDLQGNPLSKFPSSLLQLPCLKYLSISAHPLLQHANILLDLVQITQLKITHIPIEEKSKITLLQQLLKVIGNYHYERPLQQLLLELIYHPNSIANYSIDQLFKVLDVPIFLLQELALDQLTKLLPDIDVIAPNTKLILKGKVNSNLNILKSRLEQQTLQLGHKITSKTTHILIGIQPKKANWNKMETSDTILLTEKMLLHYLNKTKPTYLSGLEEDNETIVHLKSLLLSNEENNILLGLNIIQSGGLPFALKEILFWVYKTQKQLAIKRAIRQLFSIHFSKQTYEILRTKKQLKSTLSEKVLARNIAFFCKETQLEQLPLAQLVYQNWQKGIYFVQHHLSPLEQAQFYTYFQLDTKTVKD